MEMSNQCQTDADDEGARINRINERIRRLREEKERRKSMWTIEQIDEARERLGFKFIFNSFTPNEIAEIVYRARTLENPPPRPHRSEWVNYRRRPFSGMRAE
jgi:hypothetical protein